MAAHRLRAAFDESTDSEHPLVKNDLRFARRRFYMCALCRLVCAMWRTRVLCRSGLQEATWALMQRRLARAPSAVPTNRSS